jgi:hypothetical protein
MEGAKEMPKKRRLIESNADWTKRRMISASEMPATTLLQSYKDSLKFEDNPLSTIFENEILRRLWGIEPLPS